jgi:tRNA pseudouridine38-40 synthase
MLPQGKRLRILYPFAMSGSKAGNSGTRMWKITVCYDGSPFAGWQVQPGLSTVQGTLASALRKVTGEIVLPQGSGRTDAGVHALAQVASVALAAPVPPANLTRALNHILPPSIRILSSEHAPDRFHARHSSMAKTYEYRVWRPEYCPPWTAPYAYAFDFPLNIEAMQAAAAHILGTHDFRSFQAQDPDTAGRIAAADASEGGAYNTVCKTIFSSAWEQSTDGMLVYRVRGSGFLHHMVRNLVGTFLNVGRGLISAQAIPEILAAQQRSAAGPNAPAKGLWLHSVEYPPV